jgi:nucleotide-binding universal stress UspA family protein
MTDRWIVGVDGSDASVDALGFALHHALTRDVAITAVTAFHVPKVMALFTAKRGFGVDELGLSATAGHELDVIIDKLAVADRVTPMVVEGQAAHVLVDAAADAELLIMGQQGEGDLRQHRLGSVSRYCATHATSPVVVVPSGWDERPTTGRIVVGFDGSDNAAAALEWALGFATDDVTVRVVVAMDVAPWLDPVTTRERFGDEIAEQEQAMISAIDAVDAGGVAERVFVLDTPRAALREEGRSADLVVVGARGRGLIAAELLGSVSTSVVQDTVVPVVVVPDRADPGRTDPDHAG